MGTYYNVAYVLKMLLYPILVFGFITNTISFFVMKRIKSSSTAKYMSFLALVDSGVVLIGGLSLGAHKINYYSSRFISVIGCKLIPFLFYSLADFSVLIIVLMTGERFYGVWRPFQANKMSKVRIFRLNLITGCIFCCLINSHFIYTHSLVKFNQTETIYDETFISDSDKNIINKNNKQINSDTSEPSKSASANYVCEYAIWKDFYEKYWVFIDASIYSFIPSFLIFTLNILIIRLLNKADKINSNLNQKSILDRTYSVSSSYNINNNNNILIENDDISETIITQKKIQNRSKSMQVIDEKNICIKKSNPNRYSMILVQKPVDDVSKEDLNVNMRVHLSQKKIKSNGFVVYYNQRGNASIRSNKTPRLSTIRTLSNRRNNKIISTRLIVMLITINISFCVFSMPMAIIQIVYYSDVYSSSSDASDHVNYYASNNKLEFNSNRTLTNYYYQSAYDSKSNDSVDLVDLLHAIAEILQYLNHGSNFILYSMSGKTFRNETKRFFVKKINFIKEVLRSKLCKLRCSIAHNNKFSSSVF